MLYFKNVELAEKYHISLGTVRNWIEAAQAGKLNISLHVSDSKSYVANTAQNISTIEELVEKHRKYRNTKAVKLITPRPDFYKLFNQEQIYDIVTNLEIHHEIPRQYNYFDGGAGHWDKYAQRMDHEKNPNNLSVARKLLASNADYLDELTAKYQKINIVDIGVGNALPVKDFLAHFLEQNRLGRYIGIDISPEMLRIAQENIKTWFGDRLQFEGHELDISRDRFTTILAEDYIKSGQDTGNIILFLGGTLQNFRRKNIPLQVINASMGTNDLFIHSQKLDSEATRRYFDFNFKPGDTALSPNHRLIFDLFNIEEQFYDVEMGYEATARERYIRVRLKVALNIIFKFEGGERNVTLNKGEAILLWRASQDTALDIVNTFDENDFYMLQSSQTEDQEYILTISKVKRD